MNGPVLDPLRRVWRRLRLRGRRGQLERELAEEMEFHRRLVESEYRRGGWPAQEAAAGSRRRMGPTTAAREECREMWGFASLERLLQDLRYAARMFRRTPGFTAIAVLSLALGIGGNAALFSLVGGLLIRPLPYREPDRLIRITGIYPRAAVPFFQQRSRTMDLAAAGAESAYNLAGQGVPVRIAASAVTANLFSLLRVAAARGRTFSPGEDAPGRDAVVVLSDSLWRTLFGADPAVIGRVISLNGRPRQIVGILPPGFSYPSAKAQAWIPMRLDPTNFLEFWGGDFVPLLARLKPGVGTGQARREIRTLAGQFLETYPYPMPRGYNLDSTAIPLQQDLVGDVRGRLIVLMASVGIVLLIACTNVASLLLSRATTRRKEMALRAALGAGRGRVVRQLLTESVLLAAAGGGWGILLAAGGLSVFKTVLPASLPGLAQAAIDWPVAAAAGVLALLTGLGFGIVPALGAAQIDIAAVIKAGSQRSTGIAWTRLRGWLIGAEVALTVVLVISAGLLMKSLYTLSQLRLGFEPSRVLTIRISPNPSFSASRPVCVAWYNRILARAREVPGVSEATLVNALPLDGAQPTLAVDVEGHPKSPEHPAPLLWAGAISPGYLRMMRIPLLAGRDLTAADGMNAPGVVLVSAATVRHFWPGENPIGKHIKPAGDPHWRTVVGVTGDVRQFQLGKAFPDSVPGAMYMPYAQAALDNGEIPAAMNLVVKARPGFDGVGQQIHALAQDQDPNIPVGPAVPLSRVLAGSIADFRSTIRVFLCFAAVALALAAIGVYGLVSYWVSQRTFEIGLRVALGATRGGIVSLIICHGLRVALAGTVAGLAAALLATRLIAGLLVGVKATDPLTFAAVAVMVLGVAAAATALPAWRASRIDPITSLRVD